MVINSLSISISSLWSSVWPILIAILFFGFIIIIHECGHFAFAKLFDVQINEFSIGMGPAIFKRKKGETQYSLRLLPIGGYVSMEGETEGSENERAFCNKKVWQRIIIVVAGAVMNLILGLIIVGVITCSEDLIATTQVNYFYTNSVTSQFGLESGDIVKEIDGLNIFSTTDISYALSRSSEEAQEYTVTKDGEETTITGKAYEFVVERDGEKVTLSSVVFETYDNDGTETVIYDFCVVGVEKTFVNVITQTFTQSVTYARLVWLSLFDLVTGHYQLNDLSGPVGTVTIIADTISEAASGTSSSVDLSSVLTLMAFITINIGIFNLLPIPALDGGTLVFLIIEGITRKKIPEKYKGIINAIGMALLLLLVLFVTFNDVANIIRS